MRNYFLIIFTLFIYINSIAQGKIKGSNGLFGIYNEKTKKWEVPAIYNSLSFLPQYENPYSNPNPVCIIATNKNGTTIIDAKKIKKNSPIYEKVEIADNRGEHLIIKIKDSSYFYSIYNGISNLIGGFESYKVFNHYDYSYNRSFNIYVFKKGNKSSIYRENSYPQISTIDGEIFDLFDNYYYLLKQNGKFGVKDLEGKTIIPNSYDSIVNTNYQFEKLIVKKGGKWGIIDNNDSPILEIKYDGINEKNLVQIEKFIDDSIKLYPVKLNGKWGIVNDLNKTVVDYLYDSIVAYIHPLKFKVKKNGNTGLIDIKGNVLFPFNYKYFEATNNFSHEMQSKTNYFVSNTCKECNPIETEGGWGFADSTGRLLHEMNATIIPLRNYGKWQYENFDSSNYGFLWNIGGQKLKEITEIDSIDQAGFTEDGGEYFVRVADYKYSYFFKGGKTGIIGNEGKIIVPITNEDLILPLYDLRGEDPRTPKNLFTLNQINNAYTSNYCLSKRNLVKFQQNNKWGVTNLLGKTIIPCYFDSIQDFEIDRYNICEVSDSIQNTLNFPLEQYKCWKNNIIYFYTKDGQFLSKRLQQEQIIGDLNFILNPPNNGNYYFTPICNLIAINPSPEFHELSVVTENEEPNEFGDWIVVNRKNVHVIYTPTSNKFNFFNPLTSKYLFPELIEDFILLTDRSDRGLIASQWSKTNDRVKIVGQNHDNHAEVKKLDNSEIANFKPNDINQHFGRFDSIIFVKQNNKWYLRNLNEPSFKNKFGFDSLYLNSNNSYVAYNNGSFASYNFNETEFNKTKINIEFPDYGDYKLACTSCEYTYIEKKTKAPQVLYDEVGNEIHGDTLNSITKIPLITKGKLNITDSYSVPILENWVDEIIFPTPSYTNNNINLSDKNDSLFNQSYIYDFELSSIYNAKTIAYRIDKDWYLITLNENKKIEGPFDSIKRNQTYWEATKVGATKKFKVYDLTGE